MRLLRKPSVLKNTNGKKPANSKRTNGKQFRFIFAVVLLRIDIIGFVE